MSFFPTSSSFNKEPTIGFSASNVEISSKTSSSGFCLFIIFLRIGSSFLPKAHIVNSIFCHIIVHVCLYSFGKITCYKNIFLNICRRNVSVICNSPIKIRSCKIMINFICICKIFQRSQQENFLIFSSHVFCGEYP